MSLQVFNYSQSDYSHCCVARPFSFLMQLEVLGRGYTYLFLFHFYTHIFTSRYNFEENTHKHNLFILAQVFVLLVFRFKGGAAVNSTFDVFSAIDLVMKTECFPYNKYTFFVHGLSRKNIDQELSFSNSIIVITA